DHTFLYFFFQAEDGIRDFHVTGVQTCALPISLHERSGLRRRAPWLFVPDSGRRQLLGFFGLHDLTGFGIEDRPLATAAAGALLEIGRASCRERVEVWAVAGVSQP